MVKREKLRVRKTEVHLFPLEHDMGSYKERKWKKLDHVLKSIGPDFHAIAVEGMLGTARKKEMGKRLLERKKVRGSVDKELNGKCIKDKMNLLVIDGEHKERVNKKQEEKDKDTYFKAKEKQTNNKFFEEIKSDLSQGKYRDIIMTDNILKAIEHHEKNPKKKNPVKIAVIAEPHHIKQIKKYLKEPQEFKELKRTVKELTNSRFQKAKWADLMIIGPDKLE